MFGILLSKPILNTWTYWTYSNVNHKANPNSFSPGSEIDRPHHVQDLKSLNLGKILLKDYVYSVVNQYSLRSNRLSAELRPPQTATADRRFRRRLQSGGGTGLGRQRGRRRIGASALHLQSTVPRQNIRPAATDNFRQGQR